MEVKMMMTSSARVTATLLLAGTITTGLLLLPVGIVNVWAANFFGTSGPDTIDGTDDDDTIFGREGNDNLSGKDGDDYVDGDGGNDEINDGLGSDVVLAGSGDDTIKVAGADEGIGDDNDGVDKVYGGKGKDNINRASGEVKGILLIFGEADDDTIETGGDNQRGKMYGGTGNDLIRTCCDAHYDVWGGPGNDEIHGSSECSINHAFGESGNDRIVQPLFGRGGPGNDIIEFTDCSGVAYGDSGDDELRGLDVGSRLELHGGSEDDIVDGADGDDELFGDDGDDTLEGEGGADRFICGPGTDTITDFNAAEGDTKTADCENF
jgi:Ca2+-binding RTX toxin-like protein